MTTPRFPIKFFLGVDPGLDGAIAIFNLDNPDRSEVFSMPTMTRNKRRVIDAQVLAHEVKLITLGRAPCEILGIIENVHSRPRQAGAFNFGLSTGIVHGILAAFNIDFVLVAPTAWKPALGLSLRPNETPSENKTRSRILAAKTFPHLAEAFSRVKDDGRAEALLIATYQAWKIGAKP